MPTTHFDWPALTLRLWKSRTGLSNAKVAELLAAAGVHVTAQAVGDWATGATNLPAGVVPLLQTIDPRTAVVWDEALQAARGEDSEPTDDHLSISRRLLRTMAESSDLAAKGAAFLEDGAIDREDARKLLPEAVEVVKEAERLIAACRAVIDAPVARSLR